VHLRTKFLSFGGEVVGCHAAAFWATKRAEIAPFCLPEAHGVAQTPVPAGTLPP
jgi:hypothetical protein